MKKLSALLICFTLAASQLLAQDNCYDTKYFTMYQKLIQGSLDYSKQDRQTQTCLATIHSLMSRSEAPNSSSECEDAWSYANSAADDVEHYARRLIRCVTSGDFYDDCSSELRRVRNAHSDYENYVYEVQNYCD